VRAGWNGIDPSGSKDRLSALGPVKETGLIVTNVSADAVPS
jgi:hypothetical protein